MKVLVFGDLHANACAIPWLREKAQGMDGIWCLGDFVGRGPHIDDAVSFMQELMRTSKNNMWVAGNEDMYVWDLLTPNEQALFNGEVKRSLDIHKHLLKRMSEDQHKVIRKNHVHLCWFGNKEHSNADWYKKRKYAIVHATPDDPLGLLNRDYMYPYECTTKSVLISRLVKPFEKLAIKKRAHNALLFCGHTHIPMFINMSTDGSELNILDKHIRYDVPMKIPDGICVVNPGSVGNPRIGSPTCVELNMIDNMITFHALPWTEDCKKKLQFAMQGLGLGGNVLRTDKEKIKAECPSLYRQIMSREHGFHGISMDSHISDSSMEMLR